MNSRFTAGVVRETFPRLRMHTEVVYPPINIEQFARVPSAAEVLAIGGEPAPYLRAGQRFVLSLNRYERKKDVALAVRALGLLRTQLSATAFSTLHLVVAGGYDPQLRENHEYLAELRSIVAEQRLDAHVSFLTSITQEQKLALLDRCVAVVYTPSKEHFGIVPVEAMYMRKPVVAVRDGGPLESVLHERTGMLCAPRPEDFAAGLQRLLLLPPAELQQWGDRAREHVLQNFSLAVFTARLDQLVRQL